MQNSAATAGFKLPPTLDLAAAESLLDALCRRLPNEPALRLDAGAVETLTLPCIQIILAAKRRYDRMAVDNPSAAFASAFADLGLDSGALAGADAGAPAAPSGAAGELAARQDECAMPKRILTIDDSKTIRDMLMLTLADAGFDVLQAVDGKDGLDVLDREPVDLVITDINMPRMDGFEVIRQMRSNAAHKTTPILVLTTESEVAKRNVAREAGATGWMVKPFDPERLIATINKVAP